MVTNEKITLVNDLTEKLKASQSVLLTDFKGLTVAEVSDLRRRLREQSVEMRVIKNRLIKRAVAEAGYESLDDLLIGNTAMTFGIDDPVAPAKIITAYAKQNEKLVIKGGALEGRRLDAAGVTALSNMPGRHELLTQMAYGFKAPATKLATVMQQALLKIAYGMNALAAKLEEGDGEGETASG